MTIEVKSYSPIALFVYNRLEHTRKTVSALQQNEMAEQSELFIFSDGPKSAADGEKVSSVREYISTISGFKNVTIIKHKKNLGIFDSIISGVTEIVTRFGKIIVLEDDLVTSPFFLRFMNEALEFYQYEEGVISIHGYIYPIKGQLPETFFIKDTGCWGWATWKRGWDLFEPNASKSLGELEEKNLTNKFDINGAYPFTDILRQHVAGISINWDILWQASAFLCDKVTLFPGRSLVKNIGHDNSGVHCPKTDHFDTELAVTPVQINCIPIEENQIALTKLEKYFKSIKPNILRRLYYRVKEYLMKKYTRYKKKYRE